MSSGESFSPKMETLLNDGFPYKISIQKFNQHLKDVCKIAQINTITKGYKYDNKIKRKVFINVYCVNLSTHFYNQAQLTINAATQPKAILETIVMKLF